MNIGLWITPALMAGVCAVLGVTTRLELVVSGPAVDAEAEMPEFVDTEFRPALPVPVPVAISRSAPTSGTRTGEGTPEAGRRHRLDEPSQDVAASQSKIDGPHSFIRSGATLLQRRPLTALPTVTTSQDTARG